MGYLYIIKMGDTNYYKIGITEDSPRRRLAALQTGNPLPLTFTNIYKTDDHLLAEALLHRALGEYNAVGEWFNVDIHVIHDYIDKLSAFIDVELTSNESATVEIEEETATPDLFFCPNCTRSVNPASWYRVRRRGYCNKCKV